VAYRRLFEPLVEVADDLAALVLAPLGRPHSLRAAARFAASALLPATILARRRFAGERARGLVAGLAAHSILPLSRPPTGAVGLALGLFGHAFGWPFPRGGSQTIADALASYLRSVGGEIECGRRVESLAELRGTSLVLLDVTPRQFLSLAGDALPSLYRRRLAGYRYGPGAFKLDLALDGPVPWAAEGCARAATVHLGGTLDEIARAEAQVARGQHPERPFVLLAQQSLFDPTRAPAGHHTVWAYCHVPNGSTADMTERIEAQIERFAPGFRDRIVGRHVLGPAALERYNANYVGGDIAGGVLDLRQLFTRPVARIVPYSTPLAGVYLCSSSTPPGAGVHGMCGYFAARAALARRGS
jgi:phytoene dehydrogenase-like protein